MGSGSLEELAQYLKIMALVNDTMVYEDIVMWVYNNQYYRLRSELYVLTRSPNVLLEAFVNLPKDSPARVCNKMNLIFLESRFGGYFHPQRTGITFSKFN